jgi:hypothetical protein
MPLELNGETWFIPGGSAPATSVGVHFISLHNLDKPEPNRKKA